MRIFVGYGYNDRDSWIDRLVFPLIAALGCEPVHAKISYGDPLTFKVKEILLSCHAMVGFLTRRDQAGDNRWTTHAWVVQELGIAYGQQMPTIEVREDGIDSQQGMGAAYQRINFSDASHDQCLVELALALASIRDEFSVRRLRLGPPDVAENIRAKLNLGASCQYRIRNRNKESAPKPVEIVRIQGSLYVDIPKLKDDDFVEVSVGVGGREWRSDYEAVDAVEIKLVQE